MRMPPPEISMMRRWLPLSRLKTAKGSFEIRGKTMAVIGYGNIGAQVGILLRLAGDVEGVEPQGVADLAEHAIDAVPDRVALICGAEELTFAELEERANRLAHYLIDHGVKKDDKVGLYCRNRTEIVIAMLGVVKAGAIAVNTRTAEFLVVKAKAVILCMGAAGRLAHDLVDQAQVLQARAPAAQACSPNRPTTKPLPRYPPNIPGVNSPYGSHGR